MAEDFVIRAEGLGKKYLIGHATEFGWHATFRDILIRGAHDLWRKAADMAQGRAIVAGDTVEEFWALRDVSFEIRRGEVLGIIGRNGAGKSTLLKILSRITEPSEGKVTIRGRVASLLEVGTGFHPELTGRENIYLNGAILGMTRAEIGPEIRRDRRIRRDREIPRHAGQALFVGHVCSARFCRRRAFGTGDLVIDEVLAVGDAEFQKKCLGKIQDVNTTQGRTSLFVSHNMMAIQTLCSRTIVLQDGGITFLGNTTEAIALYSTRSDPTKSTEWLAPPNTLTLYRLAG